MRGCIANATRPPARAFLGALLLAVLLAGAGCSPSAGPTGSDAGTVPGAPCPVAPVRVVVSVDQWSDMVRQLGGRCADVTTVLADASADPHDFEPATADIAAFGLAKLAVVNGADYDPWAEKALAALSDKPATIVAASVAGAEEGANPHVWYSPAAVDAVAAAVTARLRELAPSASSYFDERAVAWAQSLQPYRDAVARVRSVATATPAGRTYAATEGVFDHMAAAVGLRNVTPQGYRNAAANGSDPAPGDVHELQQLLEDGRADVLVFNRQTEGAIPDQLRAAAEKGGVPVVEVTETVPPGRPPFVEWQVAQLDALGRALGG